MTLPLMEYLDAPKAPPASGAGKYFGDVAASYDQKRESSDKWRVEQDVIQSMLSDLPEGSTILDVPIGTGRFLDFYKSKGFEFIGVDLSGDMLIQAALKVLPEDAVATWVQTCNQRNQILPLRIKDKGVFINGDVREIGLPDQSIDASVMCRLTRWLSPGDNQRAFRELQRVCKKRVIWTARVENHPHARSRALFEAALLPGWAITRDVPGHEMAYRILMAERVA